MKKIIAFGAVAFSTLVFLTSCTKSASDSFDQNTGFYPERTLEAKVAQGQTQTLTIGDGGELSIARQASHFKISQTGVDPRTSSLIYTYAPAEGFSGSDEVLLALKTAMIMTGSIQCNYGNTDDTKIGSKTSYIAVKITVASK